MKYFTFTWVFPKLKTSHVWSFATGFNIYHSRVFGSYRPITAFSVWILGFGFVIEYMEPAK